MQHSIDAQGLRQKLSAGDAVQIIDVRSADEYASGHIPFAVNMPLEEVDHRLDDLMPHAPVVLVCNSGDRANMCFEKLTIHRDDVLVLEGGTAAWIDGGADVVRTSSSTWAIERQVRLTAGAIVLISTVLAALGFFSWIYVAMFIGAGLTFAGITNICGMAKLFALLPWNRPCVKAQHKPILGA